MAVAKISSSLVCATSKQTSSTVCLTSYRSPRGGTHLFDTTKKWEACRATSAATSFFDPIAVGRFREEIRRRRAGGEQPRLHAVESGPGCVGRPAARGR